MVKCDAIIFDMDGILLDTETMCRRTWMQICNEWKLGTQQKMEETFKKAIGCSRSDTAKILESTYKPLKTSFNGIEFLDLAREYFYKLEQTEGIGLMFYAKECLQQLSSHYTIALASSTRGELVLRQLKEAGLYDYIKTFTTGDMVEHSKPDPEIYIKACKSVGAKPENSIGVEDSFNGVRSAYSAGLKTVMIPDQLQPTEEISRMYWNKFDNLKEFCDFMMNN